VQQISNVLDASWPFSYSDKTAKSIAWIVDTFNSWLLFMGALVRDINAFTLLVGCQEEHLACKKIE